MDHRIEFEQAYNGKQFYKYMAIEGERADDSRGPYSEDEFFTTVRQLKERFGNSDCIGALNFYKGIFYGLLLTDPSTRQVLKNF
eukprot:CAMPEP_0170487912 /NCGR_PEP_ID=MMETSP0208-20121228/6611_1 /TAXON_ID=197538 /ORGANISM="Strombidium inclinatum, Strain S3" /LENGTH=83 /DNA_ID=CAMNT_0010762341 /DNA_START=1546 /DNA_END=1797 /DNA_ORIENTATION=-